MKHPGVKRFWSSFLLTLLTLLAASPLLADDCLRGEWWSISDDEFFTNCGPLASGSLEQRSQLAWMLFARINQQVITATNHYSQWELWATDQDTFTSHPYWPGNQARPKRLQPSNKGTSASENTQEITRNRLTFDYVVHKNPFYDKSLLEGIVGSKTPVGFPLTALAIKAEWTYEPTKDMYVSVYNGQFVGLIGLHIMYKFNLPSNPDKDHSWFWATFEYEDNPLRADALRFITYRDAYDLNAAMELLKDAGLGETAWTSYRLNGTQIEFTTPTGEPVILGNTTMEGFLALCGTTQCGTTQPSSKWTSWPASCHTCHSVAAADDEGFRPFVAPVGNPTSTAGYWLFDFEWGIVKILQQAPPPETHD